MAGEVNSMTHFEEQLKWRIDTAESSMTIEVAPDLSDVIWQKYSAKKANRIITLAACVSILSFGYWLQLSIHSTQSPSLISQGHQYEQQLIELSNITLSSNHNVVMENWYHELQVIDQIIDQSQGKANTSELWIQRTNLLKTMVEFYAQPVDVYEI